MVTRSPAALMLAVFACGAPMLAYATLGGAPTSADSTGRSLRVARTAVTSAAAHTVNEMTLASGTVVREYIANDTVFAVSWHGPFIPDLRELFGAENFDRYASGIATQKAGGPVRRGPVAVSDSQLVVVSNGHMRDFFGYAYVPGLLPAGVSPSDIK
jgi:hypothetical protein